MRIRVEELFHEIADLSAEARARYFAERGIDAGTRSEVETLLAFDADRESLVEGISELAQEALARLAPDDATCGPYQLGEVLGSGGMGTVHLAERVDGEVAQRVAVKLLRSGVDEPQLRRR